MLEHAFYPNLQGKRILVVEDDVVIAVDYGFELRRVGRNQRHTRPNKVALNYLETHQVDAALVDYQLSDGPCEPVLQLLQSRGIPFIVVSGCCTFEMDMHGSVGTCPVLSKPVRPNEVWRALSEVLQ
jgi:DNA-binding response OmpR family regulator